MFARKRRQEIYQQLLEHGEVKVDELAAHYRMSVDSIRRDLRIMSQQGLCTREYGGASLIKKAADLQTSPHEVQILGSAAPSIDNSADAPEELSRAAFSSSYVAQPNTQINQSPSPEARREVALRAYIEINDGDSVFLDISKTNMYLADIIAQGDKRLIVTTNDIGVLQRLSSSPHVTAMATGGILNVQLTGFVGSAAMSMLEPLLFAKAFVGCKGIDLDKSAVMGFEMNDGMIKERVLENASYKFLLAEEEKFSERGSYRFASINDFSAVITNTHEQSILRAIAATGTPVLS